MKKILICLVAILSVSCENYTTKHWGGTMTIDVEPGYKVTNATFKDGGNLWYFVEPMEVNYVPTQKKFVEKSMYGALEGTIIFNETR
jgi:hypothetical protein